MPSDRQQTTTPVALDELLTVREAATLLKISGSFVYKLMKTGQLAFERRGRRKMPLAKSVAEYRERSLVPSQPRSGESLPSAHPRSYLHLFSKEKR